VSRLDSMEIIIYLIISGYLIVASASELQFGDNIIYELLPSAVNRHVSISPVRFDAPSIGKNAFIAPSGLVLGKVTSKAEQGLPLQKSSLHCFCSSPTRLPSGMAPLFGTTLS
jgi:hypothetical protein